MIDTRALNAFPSLLAERARVLGLTGQAIRRALGIKSDPLEWHRGDSMPKQERLPEIAKVYGIEFDELQDAFQTTAAARREDKRTRRLVRAQ